MPSLASVGTFMHMAHINILRNTHEDIKKKEKIKKKKYELVAKIIGIRTYKIRED